MDKKQEDGSLDVCTTENATVMKDYTDPFPSDMNGYFWREVRRICPI